MTATDVEDRLKKALPEYAMPQVRIVEKLVDTRDLECTSELLILAVRYCLLCLHVVDLGDFTRIDAVSRERKNRQTDVVAPILRNIG